MQVIFIPRIENMPVSGQMVFNSNLNYNITNGHNNTGQNFSAPLMPIYTQIIANGYYSFLEQYKEWYSSYNHISVNVMYHNIWSINDVKVRFEQSDMVGVVLVEKIIDGHWNLYFSDSESYDRFSKWYSNRNLVLEFKELGEQADEFDKMLQEHKSKIKLISRSYNKTSIKFATEELKMIFKMQFY